MKYIKAVIAPTEAPAIIDDNETSLAKTWSSNKIQKKILEGGEYTGPIDLPENQYVGDNKYGMNCHNSDITGLNAMYFNDNLEEGEGLIFTRTDGQKDALRCDEGNLVLDQQLGSASHRAWTVTTTRNTFLNSNYKFGELSGTLASIEAKIVNKTTLDGGASYGSFNLTAAVSSMGAGWYNYIYLPHRNGIEGGDNYKYGTLLCFPMTTNSSSIVIIHNINGTWYTPIVK